MSWLDFLLTCHTLSFCGKRTVTTLVSSPGNFKFESLMALAYDCTTWNYWKVIFGQLPFMRFWYNLSSTSFLTIWNLVLFWPITKLVFLWTFPVTAKNMCFINYLEGIYKSQIIKCYVIVVILDVTEGFLMILHQGVDLTILALKRKISIYGTCWYNNKTLLEHCVRYLLKALYNNG